MNENSNTPRQIGLKDVHIALLTSDGPVGAVYEAPIKIGRAITAKITPSVSSETLYSDDSVETELIAPPICEIEIEQNALSLESRALILGKRYHNGEIVDSESDIPPKLALMFRSEKSNSTVDTPVYRYCVFNKGTFSEIEDEYETKGEKVAAKSTKIKGKFYSREFDRIWRLMIDSDASNVDNEKLTNFFSEVQEPTAPVVEAN
jgi:phi13 family phage major tail protein